MPPPHDLPPPPRLHVADGRSSRSHGFQCFEMSHTCFIYTHFSQYFVAGTEIGKEECDLACSALGFTALSISNGAGGDRYVCSAKPRSSFQPGEQTAGVPACNIAGDKMQAFQCLCDNNGEYRYEWKAAPGQSSNF